NSERRWAKLNWEATKLINSDPPPEASIFLTVHFFFTILLSIACDLVLSFTPRLPTSVPTDGLCAKPLFIHYFARLARSQLNEIVRNRTHCTVANTLYRPFCRFLAPNGFRYMLCPKSDIVV